MPLPKFDSISETPLLLCSQQRCKEVSTAEQPGEMQGRAFSTGIHATPATTREDSRFLFQKISTIQNK